ncbi:MAG: acetate--CoA ligase [Thermoplasmata archaeon]|nr:acetate--CoA ligase [Thermoplasmata archaeon]
MTDSSGEQEALVFPPPEEFRKKAHIKGEEEYRSMYKRSLEDPEGFWAEAAENLHWFKKWEKVFEWDKEKAEIKWFIGGKLNVSYNCLDRHIKTWRKNKAALIWVGNEPGEERVYTYQQLYREVNRFANVLKKLGVKKGDRIALYLPMIPELPIAMLAATRIGAIHSVVFGGFSAEALRDRINDCSAKILITCDGTHRGKKEVPMKIVADKALEGTSTVEKVVVVKRAGFDVEMKEGRDLWWHDLMNDEEIEDYCPPEEMDAEDPLFILYTSGSTGKPKGVLHTHGGYLTYVNLTTRLVFDLKDEDTFWCTADIGWITGHSYIVYGPLSNGVTSLMFEGVPNYPHPDRFWDVVDRYAVNVFYTAPTAIRALMREGDEWVKKHDLSTLRLLGSVGEPINPEAWLWYYKVVGKERCPIVDTWWQTETGGILITPLPGVHALKPGSAVAPFFGVEPAIYSEEGKEVERGLSGYLIIKRPWPSIARTIWGDHKRYIETYWSRFPGVYFTGDGAKKDEDGYIWITGRVDDVINVSGHRLGTAEIESALVAHPAVAEAAVVGFPHELKGQGIYAYVLLKVGYEPSEELRKELRNWVRKEIGPIATPDYIHFAENLPKTRSGKIMRRILRKIAAGDFSDFGDTSTLADPKVLDSLIEGRKKLG